MTIVSGDELLFLPLGGAGEIGMNLNLYGYGREDRHVWLMLDLGITFGGGGVPGADVLMPDPGFIVERRDRLLGIVLTHAHEDHLGAVPYLWPRLRCPIYGTPFALAILRRKLAAAGLGGTVPLRPLPASGGLDLGPFHIEPIGMTHSIPEANAIAIRTPLGTLLHSGDWKLDPDPVVGGSSDEAGLRRLGDDGVLALICDSTNVFEAGRSGSEGDLLEALSAMIAGCPAGVAVACFSSNVARLRTIAKAAQANGRDVVVTGGSLKRNVAVAAECGYLGDVPAFIEDQMGGFIPAERRVIVCTGGQGEPNAALWKLAADEHPALRLAAGDRVIFSSRVIPGNEAAIGKLQNQLLRRGIDVLTHRHGMIHVSGHPARDELKRMYELIRPRIAVPVHGELRHMIEHARLAEALEVPQTIIAENGTLVRLAPAPAQSIDVVPAGRLAADGNRILPLGDEILRERTRALYNGTCFVTLSLGRWRAGSVGMQISMIGLLAESASAVVEQINAAVGKAIDGLGETAYKDDAIVCETARLAVRRVLRQIVDKRPVTRVHAVRI